VSEVDEDTIEMFQRIYSALQRNDWEELRLNLAHDIEWTSPDTLPWGGTRHGHDGVEAFAHLFAEHVDGFWADPDDYYVADNAVIVLGRISGRGRESGRAFEVPFAHFWTLDDGVPRRFRAFFDAVPVQAALATD
jgi:uncharacterized protein